MELMWTATAASSAQLKILCAKNLREMCIRDSLIGDHGPAGLLGVRAAAHFQMVSRFGKAQIAKERVRHVRVIVLAGVHDLRAAPRCV